MADDAARAKARALGYAGVEAYAEGNYVAASAKLEESYQLLPVPSLGLWSARTLIKLGKLVEAEERYRAVTTLPVRPDDPEVQRAAQQDAIREHTMLLSRIPSVKIRITGAASDELRVSVDGSARNVDELSRALLMNPGRHSVSGVRGEERSEVVVTLAAGTHEEVELRFSGHPLAPPPSAPAPAAAVAGTADAEDHTTLRTGAWIAVGAGAAGIATGLVAYLVAHDQYAGFEQRGLCQYQDGALVNGGCTREDVDAYNSLRTVHLVGLIGGSVLAVAGATVLVLTWQTEPDRSAPPKELSLRVGPRFAVLAGSF